MTSNIFDTKYYGTEPDLKNKEVTNTDLASAYTWYSHFHDADEAKEWVISYLRTIKSLIDVGKVPAYFLRTMGWNCRMLSQGVKLPEDVLTRMMARLSELSRTKSSTIIETEETPPVASVRDHTKAYSHELIGELEAVIDEFTTNQKTEFKIDDWLRNKNGGIKAAVSSLIGEHYRPLYAELFDAVEGKDEQLTEAYSIYSKSFLKKYMEFIRGIVQECDTRTEAMKLTRKPRKKKIKPAAVVVSKLQFKDKDDDFKIVSVKSADIIGAEQLWVFNTKTRNLSVFNAMGPIGLSVKGTTVTGFDEKTSVTKKVRKPELVLPGVVAGGKVTLRRVMENITSTEYPAKGRISTDVILLKCIR